MKTIKVTLLDGKEYLLTDVLTSFESGRWLNILDADTSHKFNIRHIIKIEETEEQTEEEPQSF